MTMTTSSPLPPHRLRVLIVRHGETNENVAGIIQGQLDTDLNFFGRLQAATTARHLSTFRLDRIITSPLRRARDTAQAILEQQPASLQLQLEQDDRLKERAFGVLEGKVYARPANRSEEDTSTFEQKHHLLERLASFWNDLVTFPVSPRLLQENYSSSEQKPSEPHRDDDELVVLLVSHGATISALLDELLLAGQYLHTPLDFRPSRRENCCITEIVVPTVLDRRVHSASFKPAAEISLKKEWTVRPLHLGVQGCQRLLEIRNLELQLAHSVDSGDLQAHIHQLEASLKLSNEGLEEDGVRRKLEEDVLRGPDGQEVVQDLGYGKGVGYIVKWADTAHLEELMNSCIGEEDLGQNHQHAQANVDELVEKSDPSV
jgi:broad specificity phosphatase PhoE